MKKIIFASIIFIIFLASMPACKNNPAPAPTPTVTPDLNLAGAVDCYDAPWYSQASSGSGRWSRQVTDTHDGIDAAKSGAVPDVNSVSYIYAIAPGPGDVSFWWKVQALAGDGDFYVNTVNVLHAQDTTGWVSLTGIYLPNAVNTLKWQYKRTTTTAETGAGVALDEVYLVKYSPTPTVTVTATPLTIRFRDGQYPDASYAGTKDTYIDDNNQNVNNGSCMELQAKFLSFPNYQYQYCVALLEFDTSAGITPNTINVVGGKLIVKLKQAISVQYLDLLTISSPWAEGTQCGVTATSGATYNDSDAGTTTWPPGGINYIISESDFVSIADIYELHLRSNLNILQDLVDNKPINVYGFLLSNDTLNAPFVFYSRETPTVESRPMLEIYYYLK